ncbi:hypothetical protein ACC791_37145, partial [Rhizobium ruizarguesonis]
PVFEIKQRIATAEAKGLFHVELDPRRAGEIALLRATGACGYGLQIPLVVTSVSTWLQGEYLRAVLDRMANTFAEARARAPCSLFV